MYVIVVDQGYSAWNWIVPTLVAAVTLAASGVAMYYLHRIGR